MDDIGLSSDYWFWKDEGKEEKTVYGYHFLFGDI